MNNLKTLIITTILLSSLTVFSQNKLVNNQINRYLLKGNYYKVIALTDSMLNLEQNQTQMLYHKAFALRKVYKLKLAEQTIKEAVKIAPQNATIVTESGKIFMQNENITEAINAFSKVFFKLDTMDYSTAILLGRCYLNNKQWADAVNIYNKLHHKDPTNTYYLYKTAVCLTKQKKAPEAIPFLNDVNKMDSTHKKSLLLLHKIYVALNEPDLANKQLNKLKRIDTSNPEYYLLAGHYYMSKNHTYIAQPEFQKAIELGDQEADTRWYNGRCLYQMKKYEQAIPFLKHLEKENSRVSDFTMLADCYAHIGKYELAEKYYKTAVIKALPSAYEINHIFSGLAGIHLKQGEYKQAINAYEDCIGHCKGIPFEQYIISQAQRQIADIYVAKLNEPETALKMYKSLLKETSEYRNPQLTQYYQEQITKLNEEVFFMGN